MDPTSGSAGLESGDKSWVSVDRQRRPSRNTFTTTAGGEEDAPDNVDQVPNIVSLITWRRETR